MILPLELLCQAILAYETFKALKAAPPPRKRRNANKTLPAGGENAPRQTAYAANKRKRAMKVMLRAWLVYAISVPLEKILDYSIGWLIPFYSSFRTLAVIAFLISHKTTGDIGYTHLLLPFLKPREPSLDWIFAWLNEVLDVACYIVILVTKQILAILSIALSPFKRASRQVKTLYLSLTRNGLNTRNEEEAATHVDTSLLQVPHNEGTAKTPRRSKASKKPRYSQIATPYVPGHLVADESVYPPVQPRLHPAERSADDLPAFQEAMDRAQAAFYEIGSPPTHKHGNAVPRRMEQEEDPFLPVQQATRRTRSNGASRGDLPTSHSTKGTNGDRQSSNEIAAHLDSAAAAAPSAKALGKRRQLADETDQEATAIDDSPDKIAKTGTFEQSRDISAKSKGRVANGSKSRPARPRPQANSRLPTRAATRAQQQTSAEGIGISSGAQKAREAAMLARKQAKHRG